MERMVLTAPGITSEQSITVISQAVGALDRAQMLQGNIEARQVVVEFDPASTTLDALRAAMAAAGYPVAAAWAAPHDHDHHEDGVPSRAEDLLFTVRLLRDGITAEVGYQCNCGCKPRARYTKGSAASGHEHCCCGLAHFVGSDATRQLEEYLAQRRVEGLDADRVYSLGERHVMAPWGETLTVAFAVPARV